MVNSITNSNISTPSTQPAPNTQAKGSTPSQETPTNATEKTNTEKHDFASLSEQKLETPKSQSNPGQKFYKTTLNVFDNEFTKLMDNLSPAIGLGILAMTMMSGAGIVTSILYSLIPPILTKLNSKMVVPWLSRKKEENQDHQSKVDLNRDLIFDSETKRRLFYKIKQFLGYKSSLQTESLAKSVGTSSGNLLILHGPPGTGKSAIAEGISSITKKPLIKVNVNDIESKWIGESEKRIATQFKIAKKLGAYLFFDEADALLMPRPENSNSGGLISQNKITNTFIQNFNEYRDSVKVILATNTANSIDNAIKSRAILCHVPAPNLNMQLAILYRKLKDFGLNEERITKIKDQETKLKELLEKTFSDFTGRDIESGVKAAFFIAEERLAPGSIDHKDTDLTIDDLKQAFENLLKEREESEVSQLKPTSREQAQKSRALKTLLMGA